MDVTGQGHLKQEPVPSVSSMPVAERNSETKSTTAAMKERRFKLGRACDRCRRRRIRCDDGNPCQACISSGSACTFEENGKKGQKSKKTAGIEARMRQLEQLIQAIPPSVFAANGLVNPTVTPSPQPSTVGTTFPPSPQAYPSSIPPPHLNSYPLTNPSLRFTTNGNINGEHGTIPTSPTQLLPNSPPEGATPVVPGCADHAEKLVGSTRRPPLSPSYMYLDDAGYPRWQGETSGLPFLDSLVERHSTGTDDWFPDRSPRKTDVNPEAVWRYVTSIIPPDLIDNLVQCYLSTSYYIMPFLHIPSFMSDYGNPSRWGEPGFAALIVAICCLASRHIDDPRARADPEDGGSAGTHWFELFGRLRTTPSADRPTVHTVQAVLVAGVYAIGAGRLSRAFALLAESVTLAIDLGLHRDSEAFDCFDPIEDEVRRRTFFCVYLWDKQASVQFGRPPMIRMRDCDVGEPIAVDDEFITHEGIGEQPVGTPSRIEVFMAVVKVFVVLESVVNRMALDPVGRASPLFVHAANMASGGPHPQELVEEESLLNEICRSISPHWMYSLETMSSGDVIRVTQAERFHCVEQFVRMLIHRHRFQELLAERWYNGSEEQSEAEIKAIVDAHTCTLQIVTAHIHIAAKGLMTYYGIHVIHQLTQAGRTIIAVLLNCTAPPLQHLIPTSMNALRSCVALLRQFSGRYLCGLRSCDIIEEFCRVAGVPLDVHHRPGPQDRKTPRLPWLRPVRRKTPSTTRSQSVSCGDRYSDHSHPSPDSGSDTAPSEIFRGLVQERPPTLNITPHMSNAHLQQSPPSLLDTPSSQDNVYHSIFTELGLSDFGVSDTALPPPDVSNAQFDPDFSLLLGNGSLPQFSGSMVA